MCNNAIRNKEGETQIRCLQILCLYSPTNETDYNFLLYMYIVRKSTNVRTCMYIHTCISLTAVTCMFDCSAAEQYYSQALAIFEATTGATSPEVLKVSYKSYVHVHVVDILLCVYMCTYNVHNPGW